MFWNGIWTALALIPALTTQPQPPALSLEQAILAAIEHHPGAEAVAQEILAAEAGVRSARALANPTVQVTPAITRGGSDTELLVQQPLELNGTRSARTALAQAQLNETRAFGRATIAELILQTKLAYGQLAGARLRRESAEKAASFFERIDAATRRQVEIGTRAGIEEINTGIELARVRQALAETEAEERNARTALNTLMGREPEAPLGTLTLTTPPVSPLDEAALIERALNARPELQADLARAEALRQEANLVRAEGRPDLVPQYRLDRFTRRSDESGFGIGISIPLLDYGNRRERLNQLRASAEAESSRFEATRRAIRAEVLQAYSELQVATLAVRNYESGLLAQAEELLQASARGFEAGQTSLLALLEAQRTHQAVLAEYHDARTRQAMALARLERATGEWPAAWLRQTTPTSQERSK